MTAANTDTSVSPASTQRLVALDGIRGLAIFFVILNHIPLGVLYPNLPEFMHPFLTVMLANGKMGVSLLFLLSGFLMTWLYPQPASTLGFWSKRYARVFPPFLVMVFALAIIRSFKLFLSEGQLIEMSLNPWLYGMYAVPIVLGVAVLGRLLWEAGVQVNKRIPVGKGIFLGFLGFQVLTALWYTLVLLRVPPAEFYLTWSQAAQMYAKTVVNATLTLPFGQYISQLDGVYWSLVTEISFYLVYPVLLVPIIGAIIAKKSSRLNVLVLLSTMPFLFGLKLISERVLGFSIMQIHLFIYFVIGISLALILRSTDWKAQLLKIAPVIKHPISIIGCLMLLFSSVVFYEGLQNFYHPWVQLLWSFIVGLVVFIAIIPEASFNKWLEQRWLVALGKYSYSLYLIHSLVVEIFTQGQPEPTTLWEAGILTIVTFASSVVFARVLFFIIEAPYFNLRKNLPAIPLEASAKIKPKTERPKFASFSLLATRRAVIALTVVTVVLVYTGYRSLSAFFTVSVPHSSVPVRLLNPAPQTVPLTTETLRYEFVGEANNLGMITTSLKGAEVKSAGGGVDASDVPGQLEIRLLDDQEQLLAQTQYKVHEIGESRYHPFGFPVVADAKGKKFYLEYQIVSEDPARALVIDASDAQYRTLYLVNKSQLLKDPVGLAGFVFNKVAEPFYKPSTLYTLLYMTPLLAVLWIYLFPLRVAVKKD